MPPWLNFVRNTNYVTTSDIEPGAIEIRNPNVKLLHFEAQNNLAYWLFEHQRAKYRFLILHLQKGQEHVVIGFEVDYKNLFDMSALAPYLLPILSGVIPNFGFAFKPLRETDHGEIRIKNEAEVLNAIAARAAVLHFMAVAAAANDDEPAVVQQASGSDLAPKSKRPLPVAHHRNNCWCRRV